jgi:23S rRNA (pseudouridine1915-N3)-methyltransferase
MKLRIFWIESKGEDELRSAIDRYFNRIKHFFPIEIIEVAPEKSRQKKSDVAIMHADSARLMAALPDRGTLVVLDERGEAMTSLKFAKWLETLTTRENYGVNFVMGGDVGLDDAVRDRADKLLSLSAMTLPHQLARVVLLEQIYRACTLMRNIAYHK